MDRPTIIDESQISGSYDAVLAAMQHQQMWNILDTLAAVDAPIVVLVGNNMSAPDMEHQIQAATRTPKTVLFGFQGTAGRRGDGVVHCVRFGDGSMSIGAIHDEVPEAIKKRIATLFEGTKYRLTWTLDMDGWYKTHLTLILPVAYVCYAVDCNLRKATKMQRSLILDAAGEACDLLKKLNIPVLPEGDEEYYQKGKKRNMLSAMFWIMAKTTIGELAASDHCRHAVTEMEGLDKTFHLLRAQAGECPMPAFDTLRSQMPEWAMLHERYDEVGNL